MSGISIDGDAVICCNIGDELVRLRVPFVGREQLLTGVVIFVAAVVAVVEVGGGVIVPEAVATTLTLETTCVTGDALVEEALLRRNLPEGDRSRLGDAG